ncbi:MULTISPECIES: glycoside hydrolase family 78 protein [Arthrobacter]|uniref:alpha-L-rhamnosidase n=1 Tax=Arthrobacter terricola TaxID=2547396 RepID=A0A4R5KEM8_9MICC|nr:MULTISPECIES: glycoside hydrolase family 78 protein [Arthrobacter]MBT8161754.1 glycoside hydrolase family 78 protein [Arthrobacter sp. GN70]TDF92677.1 alpha-L-rhamnosidase [Arthrobacter terricola]
MTVPAAATDTQQTTEPAARVVRVQAERNPTALGIGEALPRLTWQTQAPAEWEQQTYEISLRRSGKQDATEEIVSSDSVLVDWPFAPLHSRERAEVRVRVSGADGNPSAWSDALTIEAGLLSPEDWTASAITPDWEHDPNTDNPPALLRRSFDTGAGIASARLYVTGQGVYEVEINGRRVGDEVLAPGWTSYRNRLLYSTFDVTGLLHPGGNAIGVWLADGWFRGRIGFQGGTRNVYGDRTSLLAQLEVTYTDGRRTVIGTDEQWKASRGPITFAGFYDGETHDARLEQPGWSAPGFDDGTWSGTRTVDLDKGILEAPAGPPVRCTEELAPQRIWTSPAGKTLIDFGQNLVGRLRLTVQGKAGDTVTLRHAEVLQDGELCTRPLRLAASTDTYILADGSEHTWEPKFAMHGFRYAEITGAVEAVNLETLTARVHHTDMERTGWFECSDPLINRLHENVRWSMRGNFVSIPTDCPQRDERLGWTGDIQVFAPTASYLYDCSGMLAGWLKDVADEQLPDGTVPWYIPWVQAGSWDETVPGAVWGDVAVLTPWTLYERFNDKGVLAAQYSSAKAWVDLMAERAGDTHLWDEGFQLGDWLDPAAPPHDPADARTDRYLVATAYFAWSTRQLSRTAGVLGKTDDEARYADLAGKVRAAFAQRYVHDDGTMTSDAQTAYALALVFDLLPTTRQKDGAADRLAELVAGEGNRIATGFAGTPVISDALTLGGHLDTAYNLLNEEECPSWLYAVKQGGTTIWERWDSMLPDGSINPGEMTSFNHYALGAVADWMHRTIGGLAPLEPGYKKIAIKPRPGGGITHASTKHLTPYGLAEVSWRIENGQIRLFANVPTGTTATVQLPGTASREVGPGNHHFTAPVL